MKIHLNSFGTKIHSIVSTATIISVLFIGLVGSASAMGINGLLGVIPGFPQIDATSVQGQGVTYDASTMTMTVISTPNFYFPDAGTLHFVNDGLLTLVANMDLAGNVLGGALLVQGTTSDGINPILGNPILFGNASAAGLENSSPNPGGTDRADFRITPAFGSMMSDSNWIAGSDIGVTLTMEGSTYAGSLASNWEASRAKLIVGPIASVGLSEPASLPLALLGLAGILFLRRRPAAIKA